jgi:uncharacterized protein YeeX (DUF496 family)
MQTQLSFKEMTVEELQAMIAAIQEELEEREWDNIVSQPHVMEWIVEKSRQARKDHQAGKTREWSFRGD